MDEYQTAMLALEKNSLALEETSLSLQKTSLALQEAALTAGHWHTAITLAVSSCLVLYGFRIMRQSTEARNAALKADQEQRRQEHTETMRRMEQQHAEAIGALHATIHGLETTIERTAPKEEGNRAGV